MNVSVNVNLLGNDEPPNKTPTEIGEEILNLLGGDLTKDTCNVSISAVGQVGTMPGIVVPPAVPSE